MFEDFLLKHFSEPSGAERCLMLIAVALAVLAVICFRKKLALAVSLALVFLLGATFVTPSFIPARPYAQRNACINNLRMIHEAKAQWASEHGKSAAEIPTGSDLFGEGKYIKRDLECPRGGIYKFGNVGEEPVCSYAELGHRLAGTLRK
jgi:hypothetical protein